jgi:hypothetical protein
VYQGNTTLFARRFWHVMLRNPERPNFPRIMFVTERTVLFEHGLWEVFCHLSAMAIWYKSTPVLKGQFLGGIIYIILISLYKWLVYIFINCLTERTVSVDWLLYLHLYHFIYDWNGRFW